VDTTRTVIAEHTAGSAPARPVRPPSGRYEFLDVLGEGAMGIVYRARDLELHRIVAVKTISPDAIHGADATAVIRRLYQEATAAARLTHPGIVTIYDVNAATGVPYVVMEYVKGRTLADLLAAGPLPPDKAAHVVVQVCHALQYAHGQGVVHRDVKSSNIMVDDAWHVKLTDFGVARVIDNQSAQTGVMVGTPAYMSPEQARGAEVDARSDLFSLGVVLYEALVGERPFPGDSVATVLDEVLRLEPLPARERNVAVSPALDAVVRRAMCKEPRDRYPDAAAFADALTHALAVDHRRVAVTALRRGVRTARRHGAALVFGGFGVAALAVAAFVVLPLGEDSAHGLATSVSRDVAAAIASSHDRAPGPAGTGASAAVASPAAVGVPADRPAPEPAADAAGQGRALAAPAPARVGCLSVNAVPFATVHVDGRQVGDTPRACLRIVRGRHRLHFESLNERSPEHVIVVDEKHTSDNPLRVSYDFRTHQFLAQ
jgi:eukaryotic-like serine/threonine-protein kinase